MLKIADPEPKRGESQIYYLTTFFTKMNAFIDNSKTAWISASLTTCT